MDKKLFGKGYTLKLNSKNIRNNISQNELVNFLHL